MSATIYPTIEEVLTLHSMVLTRYGGEPGVRDLGMLDAALHRPRSGYYRSLSEQAARIGIVGRWRPPAEPVTR